MAIRDALVPEFDQGWRILAKLLNAFPTENDIPVPSIYGPSADENPMF